MPNVAVRWLVLPLRILEVLISVFDWETCYRDCGFRGFRQYLQENSEIVS